MSKMRILFIGTSCSQNKYKQVCEMRCEKILDPQQKFCNLLIDGMSSDSMVVMECLSAIPVSASTVLQKRFEDETEIISTNLKYHYLGFKNGKISRYVSLYRNSKRAIYEWAERHFDEQLVIVCDVLPYYITRPAQIIARKKGIKIVGIVTDLPHLATKMKERKEPFIKKIAISFFQRLINKSIKNYDAYIPLTDSINNYVNNERKPALIIEGSVDSGITREVIKVTKKKIVLYAGGIYTKYGIRNLVEAFIGIDSGGFELHIYGEGSYVEDLKKISKRYPEVKYMGVVSIDEIVELEREAMLLVNPRPVSEEFSKYSFPSKTLEYMSSGTALLTTRLSGIPKEYFNYTYTFSGDDVISMKDTLVQVLNYSEEEILTMGENAYYFVMGSKNNVIQGNKIVSFIKSL